MAATGGAAPLGQVARRSDAYEDGWMEALLDDDIVQNGPCASWTTICCHVGARQRGFHAVTPAANPAHATGSTPSVVAMAPAVAAEVERRTYLRSLPRD